MDESIIPATIGDGVVRTDEVLTGTTGLGLMSPSGESSADGAAPEVVAEPAPPAHNQLLGIVRELAETFLLVVLFILPLRAVVQNFRVEGSSMFPSFTDGQYVLVNKAVYTSFDLNGFLGRAAVLGQNSGSLHYLFHEPERGDVIVFHPPPPNDRRRDFIKRVVAVPGDSVEVRDGKVWVNGKQVIEPFINQPTLPINTRYLHLTLGPNQFYVLGDNRGNSSDSRAWGPVTAQDIIGRTWLIYWPASAWKVAPNHAENVPAAPGP